MKTKLPEIISYLFPVLCLRREEVSKREKEIPGSKISTTPERKICTHENPFFSFFSEAIKIVTLDPLRPWPPFGELQGSKKVIHFSSFRNFCRLFFFLLTSFSFKCNESTFPILWLLKDVNNWQRRPRVFLVKDFRHFSFWVKVALSSSHFLKPIFSLSRICQNILAYSFPIQQPCQRRIGLSKYPSW